MICYPVQLTAKWNKYQSKDKKGEFAAKYIRNLPDSGTEQ
jgi:hypothetical protein